MYYVRQHTVLAEVLQGGRWQEGATVFVERVPGLGSDAPPGAAFPLLAQVPCLDAAASACNCVLGRIVRTSNIR
jgi:hypothetical protein